MNTALPEPVEHLDALAKELFQLEVRRQRIELQDKEEEAIRKAELAEKLAPIQTRITKIRRELYETITGNENTLIKKGKRSFATLNAIFQLVRPSSAIKVQDKEGVMSAARELGVVRKIATLTHRYTLNMQKLKAWVQSTKAEQS